MVLVLLCLFVPLVMALLTATYYMTAPVAKESVQLYSDELCVQLINPSSYAWTLPVSNGAIFYVWAKNNGNVNTNVTLTLNSNINCTVTLSPAMFTLGIDNIQKVEIGFSNVTGTTVSWSFDLKADKTP